MTSCSLKTLWYDQLGLHLGGSVIVIWTALVPYRWVPWVWEHPRIQTRKYNSNWSYHCVLNEHDVTVLVEEHNMVPGPHARMWVAARHEWYDGHTIYARVWLLFLFYIWIFQMSRYEEDNMLTHAVPVPCRVFDDHGDVMFMKNTMVWPVGIVFSGSDSRMFRNPRNQTVGD